MQFTKYEKNTNSRKQGHGISTDGWLMQRANQCSQNTDTLERRKITPFLESRICEFFYELRRTFQRLGVSRQNPAKMRTKFGWPRRWREFATTRWSQIKMRFSKRKKVTIKFLKTSSREHLSTRDEITLGFWEAANLRTSTSGGLF